MTATVCCECPFRKGAFMWYLDCQYWLRDQDAGGPVWPAPCRDSHFLYHGDCKDQVRFFMFGSIFGHVSPVLVPSSQQEKMNGDWPKDRRRSFEATHQLCEWARCTRTTWMRRQRITSQAAGNGIQLCMETSVIVIYWLKSREVHIRLLNNLVDSLAAKLWPSSSLDLSALDILVWGELLKVDCQMPRKIRDDRVASINTAWSNLSDCLHHGTMCIFQVPFGGATIKAEGGHI